MKEKRISFGQGKGSLTHNNRTFIAKNVDESRIPDNVVFIAQPIAEAYDYLFADSVQRYNARQKRNDRKIHGSYYESLFHQEPCNSVVTAADKRKSFYEDVVQIGKIEDSGIGTEDATLVAECLKEYMNGFQKKIPTFMCSMRFFTWMKLLPICTSTTYRLLTTSVEWIRKTVSLKR